MGESKSPTPNDRLRRAREERCWLQKDVADKLYDLCLEEDPDWETIITADQVGRWERGVKPSIKYQAKLCALFEKKPGELGFVTDEQPGVVRSLDTSSSIQMQEQLPSGQLLAPTPASPQTMPLAFTPHYQVVDQLCEGYGLAQTPVEQPASSWLALATNDLLHLLANGWTSEAILQSLAVLLQGGSAMAKISRRQLLGLGAAAMVVGIPNVADERNISLEEKTQLHQALSDSLAAGWMLFHTVNNAQVLAVSEAQLILVKQVDSHLYPILRPIFYSSAYRLKGAALFFQGRYDEAYQAQNSAYMAALEGGDAWNMAQSRVWQVYGHQVLGQHTEAIQVIETVLRLAHEQNDETHRRLRSHLLASWAENAAMLEGHKIAQEQLEASATLLEGIGPNEEFDHLHWAQIAGNCALAAKDYSTAIQYYQEALDALPSHWIMRRAVTAMPLAVAYARSGERDASLDVANNAVSLIGTFNAPVVNKQLNTYIQNDLFRLFPNDTCVKDFVVGANHQLPRIVSVIA